MGGLGAAALAFLATTPYASLTCPTSWAVWPPLWHTIAFGHTGHEGDDNWLFFAGAFLSSDFVPTLLTLVGVAFAFIRHRREDILLLAFPVAFYFAASAYRVNFERNLLRILPFTSILAALPLVLLGVTLLDFSGSGTAHVCRVWAFASPPLVHYWRWRLRWRCCPLRWLLPSAATGRPAHNRVRAVAWLNANTRRHRAVALIYYSSPTARPTSRRQRGPRHRPAL